MGATPPEVPDNTTASILDSHESSRHSKQALAALNLTCYFTNFYVLTAVATHRGLTRGRTTTRRQHFKLSQQTTLTKPTTPHKPSSKPKTFFLECPAS